MGLRGPKKLENYSPAEAAARGLEQIAAEIRACALDRPLVRWSLDLHFWNPAWTTPAARPKSGVLVAGTSFRNK